MAVISKLIGTVQSFHILTLQQEQGPPLVLTTRRRPLLLVSFHLKFEIQRTNASLPVFLLFSFDCPILYIPENSNTMMAKNCILCNSLDLLIRHIIYIAITEESICRIFCKCSLELCICFFSLILITCLSCLRQISVYLLIGISAVIASFVRSEYFVGMIICIKWASPSDQKCFLICPVDL